MSKETIELLVEGGKAVTSPQMAQSLGPKGINMKDVLAKINEKTSSFKGMKVPVKVIIDAKDKSFDIKVGTPPTSELIKNEIGVKKAASYPNVEKIGNLSIEQVIKIAKMKEDSILHNSFKASVKTVIGSCNSLGVLVEGLNSKEVNRLIEEGKFDKEIKEARTEMDSEKKKILEEQLKKTQSMLQAELENKKAKEKPKEGEKKEEGKEDLEKKSEKKEEPKKEGKKKK